MMSKTRKVFDKEFKVRAVQMSYESASAAREKGYIYVVDIIGYGASQDNPATSL